MELGLGLQGRGALQGWLLGQAPEQHEGLGLEPGEGLGLVLQDLWRGWLQALEPSREVMLAAGQALRGMQALRWPVHDLCLGLGLVLGRVLGLGLALAWGELHQGGVQVQGLAGELGREPAGAQGGALHTAAGWLTLSPEESTQAHEACT